MINHSTKIEKEKKKSASLVRGKKSRGPYTTNPNSLSNLPLIFDFYTNTNPNSSLISFEIHARMPHIQNNTIALALQT